ncbi:hypothetical protein V495_06016 [Pseudogymnoascus sp. VKM F-4514 (FW-929)]|nr:hypothetical protein V495_06016 [Pseudogymnoascus sp. VKM F-4514 (FW-929)]KFY62134.1 hypothetical protein V497_02544 [Pseudogymnoascus sp. VKM F-4516 (FW-969)]
MRGQQPRQVAGLTAHNDGSRVTITTPILDGLILKIESLVENLSVQPKDNPEDQGRPVALATAKFNESRSPNEIGLIPRKPWTRLD